MVLPPSIWTSPWARSGRASAPTSMSISPAFPMPRVDGREGCAARRPSLAACLTESSAEPWISGPRSAGSGTGATSFLFAAGFVLPRAMSLLTIPVYTRLLGPADFGRYGLDLHLLPLVRRVPSRHGLRPVRPFLRARRRRRRRDATAAVVVAGPHPSWPPSSSRDRRITRSPRASVLGRRRFRSQSPLPSSPSTSSAACWRCACACNSEGERSSPQWSAVDRRCYIRRLARHRPPYGPNRSTSRLCLDPRADVRAPGRRSRGVLAALASIAKRTTRLAPRAAPH